MSSAERRDQILDAANALFAEAGYDAVSIEDIAGAAGVTGDWCTTTSAGARRSTSRCWSGSVHSGKNSCGRPSVAAPAHVWRTRCHVGCEWTETNRTIYLGTIAPGEDIADPDVRHLVAELMGRAVVLVTAFHADIAQDSPRLRYALECWTGLNRAATRRWLRGEATREATHELLAVTLEHVLRTFGSRSGRTPRPTRSS